MKTKNCVRCGKPAKFYLGHVLDGKKKITAGWCSNRCANAMGFRGHYVEYMEKVRE